MRLLWKKDIEPLVQGFLKDEPLESSAGRRALQRYDGETLRSWWNLAQARLATLIPIQKHVVYQNEPAPFALPELFYQPRVFHGADWGYPLPRISIEQAFLERQEGYYLQEGRLYLANLKHNGVTQAFLLYDSYLPRVENDESPVRTPEWAIEPCALYVCMQAATRESMGDARYRKFAQPTDAGGNPTHNPFVHVAKFLEDRFNAIIATHSTEFTVMVDE